MFDESLTDRIYEAAVIPDLWPEVLGQLSQAAEGAGGILFTADHRQMRWTTSANIRHVFEEFIRDGWAAINQRPKRLAASNYSGFVRDQDFFSQEELETDAVYTFLRKKGLGWGTGALVTVPSGESLIFSFERAYDKGPVPVEIVRAFDEIKPHLSRAALMSARLGMAQAGTSAETLQAIGLPGAMLRANGSLLNANVLFENLMPNVVQDSRARLKFLNEAADNLFAEALKPGRPANIDAVNSIPIPAADARVPLIAHVLPVKRSANDIFQQAAFLVVITPVDRTVVPTAKVLQGLFDLTPAEARVARALSEAHSVEAAAKDAGVSIETVRSQLKSVLAKTGLSRQQELVHLLAGKALPFR